MASDDRGKVTLGIERARELVDDWQRLRAGVCRRCGALAGTMKSLCPACAAQRKVVRRDYRMAAAQRSSAGSTSMQSWLELHRWVSSQGYGLKEIAGADNVSAGSWLASFVDLAIATGEVDDDDVAQFDASAALLPVSRETVAAQRNRLIRARWFLDLQHGRLPLVGTNVVLAAGEVCHLDTPISMYPTSAPTARFTPGRLIVTNHRLILGPRELPLIDVRRAVPFRSGVVVEPLTDGFFTVGDPQWVIALINAAVQVARGELRVHIPRETPSTPASAFAAAASALEEADRGKDAALVRSITDRWSELSPEMQVRAQRAAEAISGTYAVLRHLPPEDQARARADGFSPAQNAAVSVDNAMRALSGILLSEYDEHADQLSVLRKYTAQWSDDDGLTL